MKYTIHPRLRLLARLLAIIPPLLFLIFAAVFVRQQFQRAHPELMRVLASELSTRLELDLTFNRVDTSIPGKVTVYDVAASKPGIGKLFQARSATIWYSIPKWVRKPEQPVSAVTRVLADSPVVYVDRDSQGRINYAKAFPPGTGRREPFSGRVEAKNALVYFTDQKPPGPVAGPARAIFRQVDASADFRSGKGAILELSSRSAVRAVPGTAQAISGPLKAHGGFSYGGDLTLSGTVSDLALDFLGRHYVPRKDIRLLSGRASGRFLLTASRARPKQARYWLKASARGVSADIPARNMRITDASGAVEIADNSGLVFDGTATGLGGVWSAAGAIAPLAAGRGTSQVLWIDAQSRAVDYRQALSVVPPGIISAGVTASGRGPVSLRVRGTLADPALAANLRVPQLTYQNNAFSDVRAVLDYSDRSLRVRASGSRGRGVAAGEGEFAWAGGLRGSTRFRFNQIAIDDIPIPQLKSTASGLASGEGELAIRNGSATGAVRFQVGRPSVLGRTASSVRGRLAFDGRRVVIQSLLVATREGFLTASGPVWFDGRLDLDISAVGIQAADVLADRSGVRGDVDFDGQITGNISDPVFDGQVQLTGGEYEGERVDFAFGNVTASRSRLHSDDLLISRGLSEVRLSGDVFSPLSPSRRLALNADVRSLDLEDFREYVPALDNVSGIVSGRVTNLTGRPDDLKAEFDLGAQGFRYRAFAVGSVRATGSYDGGLVTLTGLAAEKGSATLTASGTVDRDGQLDLQGRLVELPVSELLLTVFNRVTPVGGTLSASGRVSGTVDSPSAKIDIEPSTLTVSGETIQLDAMSVELRDNRITSNLSRMQLAGGVLTVSSLSAYIGEEPGVTTAQVTLGEGESGALDVPRLVSIARASGLAARITNERLRNLVLTAPERVTGSVTGSLTVTLDTDQPSAAGNLTFDDLVVWGVDTGQVSIDGSYGRSGFVLERLQAENGEAVVVASGRLDADGALVADIEGNNIPLESIPSIPALAASGGTIDFSFQGQGTLVDPQIEGSVLITDATIRGIKLEQIDTGRMTLDKDSADISEAIIAAGAHRVRLSGTVPFSITAFSLVEGSPIDLQATLLEQDLDVLALFSNRIDTERTEGEARASVSAAGTWPSFEIDGLIEVADGSIAVKGMDSVMRDVQVRIDLSGDRADIERFSMKSTDGGELVVTGGARLAETGWQIDAKAQAERLGLDLRNVSGLFDESFSGKVRVDLALAGSAATPALSGEVEMQDAVVGLPNLVETEQTERTPVFDPRFNVRFIAGRGSRVRNPRLNVQVRGNVLLAQSLSTPSLTGQLEVIEGYLLFPGSRFRVVPVGLIEFAYEPPETTRVTLDIRAQTNLTSSVASGLIGGSNYRVEMQIRGPLNDPRVTFQSNPPGLDSSRIVGLLGQQAGIGPSGFGGEDSFEREVTRIFTASVAPGLFEPLELALADALGLQEFTLGIGTLEPINVQLTRRLFDGVSLTYWRSLASGDEVDEWKLSYDLTNNIRLSYGETRFRTKFVGFEGTFRF